MPPPRTTRATAARALDTAAATADKAAPPKAAPQVSAIDSIDSAARPASVCCTCDGCVCVVAQKRAPRATSGRRAKAAAKADSSDTEVCSVCLTPFAFVMHTRVSWYFATVTHAYAHTYTFYADGTSSLSKRPGACRGTGGGFRQRRRGGRRELRRAARTGGGPADTRSHTATGACAGGALYGWAEMTQVSFFET